MKTSFGIAKLENTGYVKLVGISFDTELEALEHINSLEEAGAYITVIVKE